MSILRNAIFIVATISFFTFVGLFGRLPVFRKTPIGWLQRALCLHIPRGFQNVDKLVTGGRVTEQSETLFNYLFYKRNPVVLTLFMFLFTGSASLFVWNSLHLLPARLSIPIWPLVALPYVFTYLCVAHTTHYIVPSNHAYRLRDYPYDHTLFRPDVICQTCNLIKPARSKHCSFCNACVAKCDHHCPWVNTCLGRGNYRWFLLLLLSLGIVEFYGAYLSWWILKPWLQLRTSSSLLSFQRLRDILDMLGPAIAEGGLSIAGVGMLTVSTATLPLGLLAYHLYLIWAGMTTNESQKWADWRDDMADGYAFVASRARIRAHLKAEEERFKSHDASSQNGEDHCNARFLGISTDEADGPYAPWPLQSDQVLVATKDGHPPYGQEELWKKTWSLTYIVNVYDLGGWQNLVDVANGR